MCNLFPSHFFLTVLLLHLVGVVSFVRLNPGRKDCNSGGWQSHHYRVGGPAGDRALHEPAAQSRKQQSHPGYHDHTGGSAEPQAGQDTVIYTYYKIAEVKFETKIKYELSFALQFMSLLATIVEYKASFSKPMLILI